MAFDNPAKEKGFQANYPTPSLADVLFYEVRDSLLDSNTVATREYGVTPHPDATKFPHHRLVLIAPHDEAGSQRWWYAADRENQDDYNFSFSFPYSGFKEFPRITRDYVVPRKGYQPLAKGTPDPHSDRELAPEFDNPFKFARLVFEEEVPLDTPELRNTYIRVRRVFDAIPTPEQQLLYNVSQSFPYAGVKTCPRYTRRFVYPRQEFFSTDKGTPDPIFPDAQLVAEEQNLIEDPTLASLCVAVTRVYDSVPSVETQRGYNAEITYPYFNKQEYPRITRKFIVERGDVPVGAPQENVEELPDTRPNALAKLLAQVTDPDYENSSLLTSFISRFSESDLDSRYVMVTQVFDVIPDSETLEAEFSSLGYRVLRPHGSESYPRVIWRIPVSLGSYAAAPLHSECPIPAYSDLRLIGETLEGDANEPFKGVVIRDYDTLPGPTLVSREVEVLPSIPEKFIQRREVETSVTRVVSPGEIPSLGGSPVSEEGQTRQANLTPDDSNTGVTRNQVTSLKVVMVPLTGYELDPDSGNVFPVTQEVVPAGTGGTDVNSGGYYSEVQPYNADWSIRTTRKISGIESRTYTTVVHFDWPPVLLELSFTPALRKGTSSGTYVERYKFFHRLRRGYSGPCKVTVTEQWQRNPFNIVSVPVQMLPEAIEWDMVMSQGQIAPCLHAAFYLYEIVGDNHPIYPYSVSQILFPATNYINWPVSILGKDTQYPFRGGYKRETWIVDRPLIP